MRDYDPFDDLAAIALSDVAAIRRLLVAAAREGEALSYSDVLARMGHRFTRPKMRAFCRALDAIDEAGQAAGEPGLAALVVRESDRLPGQGWWVGRAAACHYEGPWTGAEAAAFVRREQQRAFDFWRA
jgi:hypothetical protein